MLHGYFYQQYVSSRIHIMSTYRTCVLCALFENLCLSAYHILLGAAISRQHILDVASTGISRTPYQLSSSLLVSIFNHCRRNYITLLNWIISDQNAAATKFAMTKFIHSGCMPSERTGERERRRPRLLQASYYQFKLWKTNSSFKWKWHQVKKQII